VRRPAYRITIGGRVIDTTDEPRASTVTTLDVRLGFAATLDSAALVLGRVGDFAPREGDDIAIELGYADSGSLQRVLTGVVTAVDAGLTTTRVLAHGAGVALARLRVDRTFENQTVGGVVRTLASDAGMRTAQVEDGPTFPAYVVDGRRPAFAHVRDLADLTGMDAYVDPDGGLILLRFAGGRTVHVLEFGQHFVALEGLSSTPRAATVEAWGAGGGGGRGGEAWAWLVKDFAPTRGTEGAGAPTLLLERSALRTAEATRTAARSLHDGVARDALRAHVRMPGRPEARLGDAVRIQGAPDGRVNTAFQIRGVMHRLDKRHGFATNLELRSTT
jgi:phage protein D